FSSSSFSSGFFFLLASIMPRTAVNAAAVKRIPTNATIKSSLCSVSNTLIVQILLPLFRFPGQSLPQSFCLLHPQASEETGSSHKCCHRPFEQYLPRFL